ncbi:hypothetical protein HAX54_027352, partial [Datura stramonium]|nr:hypothetical protein [Datura stramonium]
FSMISKTVHPFSSRDIDRVLILSLQLENFLNLFNDHQDGPWISFTVRLLGRLFDNFLNILHVSQDGP